MYWKGRDLLSPPTEKAILFVAHPDDDTLFFHSFIKEHKPYVVLCTAGWSLRRLPCFFRAMKRYGVKYRAYDLKTRDKRADVLERIVKDVLKLGHFEMCATHNVEGEYGHEMHRRVHQAVMSQASIPVWVPVDAKRIGDFPIDEKNFEEKRYIFSNIYTTEKWVLEQYYVWVNHEKLEQVSL
jgi:hypothetical protein